MHRARAHARVRVVRESSQSVSWMVVVGAGGSRVCVVVDGSEGVECGPCKLLDPCFNIQPEIVPKKAEEEAVASSRRSALVSRRAMVVGSGGLADGCRVCVCVAVAVGGIGGGGSDSGW